MTSKEALQIIWNCYDAEAYETYYEGAKNVHEEELKIIEKDLDRLEEHRKIEKELGIELTIFFAALKNGVYYFDEQGQLIHDYVWLVNNYITAGVPDKLSFSFKTFLSGKILLFAGYGKEWALTEERLRENCIINIYDIYPL